ncbi:MAG: hypothetical protein JRH20_02955 [Deltaproteobacteria bacterium]|nr:hypothetical protein [Deltaproteobacteria bacterium]
MIEKLKKQAMERGVKLLSNPKVMKVMADPRFMNAIMKSMELRGRLKSDFEGWVANMARSLNLATQDDLTTLEQSVQRMEAQMEAQLKEDAPAS